HAGRAQARRGARPRHQGSLARLPQWRRRRTVRRTRHVPHRHWPGVGTPGDACVGSVPRHDRLVHRERHFRRDGAADAEASGVRSGHRLEHLPDHRHRRGEHGDAPRPGDDDGALDDRVTFCAIAEKSILQAGGRTAMQVKEILRVKGNRLLSIEPAGRASEAVKTMAKENLGSLVVMEQGRMVGMLTFHELLRALASRGGSLGELKVSEIMIGDPVTAAPEMEVNDLRRTMLESGARYLPVMKDGKLLGVISFRDVAKAVLEEQDFENKMLKGYIKNWPA